MFIVFNTYFKHDELFKQILLIFISVFYISTWILTKIMEYWYLELIKYFQDFQYNYHLSTDTNMLSDLDTNNGC